MTFIEKFRAEFRNRELLDQAITHKSFHNENPRTSNGHNERLEFLGDAVIDLALSDYLMGRFPEMSEGNLSKVRASLVNEQALAQVALDMGFDRALRLGKGEAATGGARKPRLMASAFEAFVGCLYKEMGYLECSKFLAELFSVKVDELDLSVSYATDYKTRLQEVMQEKKRITPTYKVIKEEGPDHDKLFHVEVCLEERALALGCGKSKKQAEQHSAMVALNEVEL
jgi:ribonuclease-3